MEITNVKSRKLCETMIFGCILKTVQTLEMQTVIPMRDIQVNFRRESF